MPFRSMHDRIAMHNANEFKIGVFGFNCSSGRTATTVADRWRADWADCLKLAVLCDQAGIDFLLPIGRWKGYGGETDFQGTTLETITWATALLAATRRITVFGTVHAPLFHPLVAAKQFVTADHVGEGRFALNVVAGWNEGEFEMFGVEQRDHEKRYAFADEWLEIVRRAWTEADDFDFDGHFFKLRSVRAKPKPFGGTRPLIMNAGASGAGQSFALRNCDAFFTATTATRGSLEAAARRIDEVKSEARSYGRNVEVFTNGQVICRPTQSEAEEFYRYANIDNPDWDAIEGQMRLRGITRQNTPAETFESQRAYFASNFLGGFPFVGTPDRIAEQFANLSRAGLRGIAISFVNYLSDISYFCDEVLPRLVRAGLRQA